MTTYAELIAQSNFSFLRGASHPHEIVGQAAELKLAAIGIADRNTLAGVVRAHVAARECGIRLLIGVRLVTVDGFEAACFPVDRAAYGRLCRLLTLGNRRAVKGQCLLTFEEVIEASPGQILIAIPPRRHAEAFAERLGILSTAARGNVYLAAAFGYRGDERRRLGELAELAARTRAPMIATTDALYHHPVRRPLADVLTCIREKCTIAMAGFRLEANAERHLKGGIEMARLFADYPGAVERTLEIAGRITFSLEELRYEYPDEPVPSGKTAQGHLEELTWELAGRRYPSGVPRQVKKLLGKELALIARLDYARYFLTVYDVVRFAQERGILCQGRGSAANSAVCFCLGITAVDPTRINVLFERFISAERREPPDIDVDFEHERREEVIQYLYRRYGRERAAICATVIHYRPRMAIREVGKALGLKEDVTAGLSGLIWGSGDGDIPRAHIRDAGLDPGNPLLNQVLELARTLLGFPRHLSQHVGGFVLTRARLDETVPVINAAMPDRTNIEWDKDDIDALGMLKVDVLALGMLTCIRKAIALIERHHGTALTLATVPAEDPEVYDMLCRADSVGVFQVESRAQMSMLPRLKPRCFYDLVIEVAIVRPGPIQGDMVHPYLRRRANLEEVTYPSTELRAVLDKTLGVPLFQEQAMQIAIVGAGFSPGEADRLRRAMATFRHTGTIHTFREKFIIGMIAHGYARDFAERCFGQIEGFGEYGFPESHAASFALLVYVSAWIKRHYPQIFCAAMLNSQPMGFYAPAQLVRDAVQHGVEVRHPDVNCSEWDCTLEPSAGQHAHAVRLGLRLIGGLAEKAAREMLQNKPAGGYRDIPSLWRRSGAPASVLERLADADAFGSIGLDRRAALWAVKGLDGGAPQGRSKRATCQRAPLMAAADGDLFERVPVDLPAMTLGEHVVHDYAALSLSLKAHPIAFFRDELTAARVISSAEHWDEQYKGRYVVVAGLVLVRQQPGTAKGVIFITLEDETGIVNVVVWPKIFARHRRIVMTAQFLEVRGRLEREGLVLHVMADRLIDRSDQLRRLASGEANLAAAPHPPQDAHPPAAHRQTTPAGDDRNRRSVHGRDPRPQPSPEYPDGTWTPRSRDFH
jgi:error-prone DNA polymerase